MGSRIELSTVESTTTWTDRSANGSTFPLWTQRGGGNGWPGGLDPGLDQINPEELSARQQLRDMRQVAARSAPDVQDSRLHGAAEPHAPDAGDLAPALLLQLTEPGIVRVALAQPPLRRVVTPVNSPDPVVLCIRRLGVPAVPGRCDVTRHNRRPLSLREQ